MICRWSRVKLKVGVYIRMRNLVGVVLWNLWVLGCKRFFILFHRNTNFTHRKLFFSALEFHHTRFSYFNHPIPLSQPPLPCHCIHMNYMKWFNEFSSICEFFVYKHVLQIFEQIRKQYWNDFDDHLKGLSTLNIGKRRKKEPNRKWKSSLLTCFRSSDEAFFSYFFLHACPLR